MTVKRKSTAPYSSSLERARMRLRSYKRRASNAPPRRAAAVLTMVDLLSCAFGGGIFLFLITAAPFGRTSGAAPSARTNDGFLTIQLQSEMVRPMFILKEVGGGTSFVVDSESITGRSVERRVKLAKAGPSNGRVYAVGPTPWDVAAGTPVRKLVLRFEEPAPDWCISVATANDDSYARKRGADQISEARITLSIQRPGGKPQLIDLGPVTTIPPALEFSPCIRFSFKAG